MPDNVLGSEDKRVNKTKQKTYLCLHVLDVSYRYLMIGFFHLVFFFFCLFVFLLLLLLLFLGPLPRHMEVPKLGVESEL